MLDVSPEVFDHTNCSSHRIAKISRGSLIVI